MGWVRQKNTITPVKHNDKDVCHHTLHVRPQAATAEAIPNSCQFLQHINVTHLLQLWH
jgi:alpha-D-ribose 1-methylphosphonate 5-triphosphate diphosphatase PhnM